MFPSLVTVATRWPRASLLSVALLVVASGLVVVLGPLDVSTSRRGLISNQVPHQARLMRFFERFGRPDSAVLVLAGGGRGQRQAAVDRLLPLLQEIPELKGRVLGRLGPEQVAEVILLHEPGLLQELAGAVEQQGERALQGSLVAWARHFERRIQEGLDGDADPQQYLTPGGSEGADENEALRQMARAVRALDAELRGKGSARLAWGEIMGAETRSGRRLDREGYLISKSGEHHYVVMFPRIESDEGVVLAPLVDRIRKARDRALSTRRTAAVKGALTGVPALAADELRILRKGLRNTSLLSALGIFLLLYFAFRSLRHCVLALVPLSAGIVITLGVAELVYDGLNLVTSSFTSVLLGLGIDFGVHLLHRYSEQQREGDGGDESAMRLALIRAGPGVTTGAITTVLAFFTVTTTDFTAFAELGVITVIGISVMMVCAFVLIPPLMRFGAPQRTMPAPELVGVGRIVTLVGNRPRAVLTAAALATAGAVFSFAPDGPGYQGRFYDFLPEQTESYMALHQIDRDGGMGPAFANFEAGSFQAARVKAEKLRAAPEVGEVQTVTDLLPLLDKKRLERIRTGGAGLERALQQRSRGQTGPGETPDDLVAALIGLQDAFDEVAFALQQAGRDPSAAREVSAAMAALKKTVGGLSGEGRERLASIERRTGAALQRAVRTARAVAARGVYQAADLPSVFRRHFVSKDGKLLAVYAYPSGDIWQPRVAERFSQAVLAIDPNASGLAVNIRPNERLIIDGFKRAALLSAIFIAIVLLMIFRNLLDAALAMLPVTLGWIWMLGAMKPLGLTFNAANVVALPLLLGIGLDAGAHMVHRFRESRSRGQARTRLADLVGGTGAAVIVASLTTMAGFGALMTADYRAMQSMGLLLTAGIGLCLLASVLVLPALLVVLGRAQ